MLRRTLFFALLLSGLILAAKVGERHSLQVDLSARQVHTLSTAAQTALEALPDGLAITAFVPDYAVQRAELRQLLAPYIAYSPQVRLQFVDPVRQPEIARAQGASRHGEIHLYSGPRREVIAMPGTQAIDRALTRLALHGEHWIVSLKGHGESPIDAAPGGLGTFVGHIEELGYRVIALDPRQLDALPENTALLLIAGPREPYEAHTEELIEKYIDAGGALLWLLDGAQPGMLGTKFGVAPLPGIVVDAMAAQYRLDSPDYAIVSDFPAQLLPQMQAGVGMLHQAQALTVTEGSGWQVLARLHSSPRSWNETGNLRGQIARDPDIGEQAGPLTVGLALQQDNGRARAVFVGSRQFIGNGQIGQGANQTLATGLLRWLTDNQGLADLPTATDMDIDWSPQLAGLLAVGLMGLLPILYLATGIWLRHRRRRA
ncbi:MAG: GldG family protein [Chromatiaceae bacterium]|jgi:hypothetical protein|nr:GldG family protein [Chromatiaceae bacterium]